MAYCTIHIKSLKVVGSIVFLKHTLFCSEKVLSEYDQEIPHSQTQPTLWHREEEPLNNHKTPGRQIKQSNQLSLPHQNDCSTRMDMKYLQQNIAQLQTPTMGVTINKKSTTTEPPI